MDGDNAPLPILCILKQKAFARPLCAQDLRLSHARVKSNPDSGTNLPITALPSDLQHFAPVRVVVALIADGRNCHTGSLVLIKLSDLECIFDGSAQVGQYVAN